MLASRAWDPYPYILLNRFLSMLAGLNGVILLIAAKRQDAIAAAMAQHDFDTNVEAKAEIEQLMAINGRQLQGLAELQTLTRTGQPDASARGAHEAAGNSGAVRRQATASGRRVGAAPGGLPGSGASLSVYGHHEVTGMEFRPARALSGMCRAGPGMTGGGSCPGLEQFPGGGCDVAGGDAGGVEQFGRGAGIGESYERSSMGSQPSNPRSPGVKTVAGFCAASLPPRQGNRHGISGCLVVPHGPDRCLGS